MKKLEFFLGIFLIINNNNFAQTENKSSFTTAIEDNSMFIEEAYNQENKVVQHISNFVFLPNLKDNFQYAFTQEWPAFGLDHQLSYTFQYISIGNEAENINGIGDLLINYRYQLSYKENFIACSPRLSIIIPTGNSDKGLGTGSWGMQVNIPVSKRWTNHFINHFNFGSTVLFNLKKEEINYNKSQISYFAGLSSIWLVTEKFNLMFECISNLVANPDFNNKDCYSNTTILAPAFRYAFNIKKIQIVPGISLPFSITKNSKTEMGGFFYLSLEHAY